jgi:hypothetical protein
LTEGKVEEEPRSVAVWIRSLPLNIGNKERLFGRVLGEVKGFIESRRLTSSSSDWLKPGSVEGETAGPKDVDGLASDLSKEEGEDNFCNVGSREERFVSTEGGSGLSESPRDKWIEWSVGF